MHWPRTFSLKVIYMWHGLPHLFSFLKVSFFLCMLRDFAMCTTLWRGLDLWSCRAFQVLLKKDTASLRSLHWRCCKSGPVSENLKGCTQEFVGNFLRWLDIIALYTFYCVMDWLSSFWFALQECWKILQSILKEVSSNCSLFEGVLRKMYFFRESLSPKRETLLSSPSFCTKFWAFETALWGRLISTKALL